MKTKKKELAIKLSDVLLETLKDKILNKKTKKFIQESTKKIAKKVVESVKKAEKKAVKAQHILARKQDIILPPSNVKGLEKEEINIVNRSIENRNNLKNQPVDHQVV